MPLPPFYSYTLPFQLGPEEEPDRYTFEKRIGEGLGSGGRVYSARDKKGNKVVIKTGLVSIDEIICLKRIKECIDNTKDKNKQKLCKKYLMHFYDEFKTQDSQFVVVENLEPYIDLRVWIKQYQKKNNTQSKRDIITLMDNIINGYLALESIQVSHNDIFNIMINPKTLDIKIIDFGECYPSDIPIERHSFYNDDLERITVNIFNFLNKYMYKKEPDDTYSHKYTDEELDEIKKDNEDFTIDKISIRKKDPRKNPSQTKEEKDLGEYLNLLEKENITKDVISLYEWLGGDCEVDKRCDENLKTIEELKKTYPNEFRPFGTLDELIHDVLDKNIKFGISLSSIPGHFIFVRMVYNLLRVQEVNPIQMMHYIKTQKYGELMEARV